MYLHTKIPNLEKILQCRDYTSHPDCIWSIRGHSPSFVWVFRSWLSPLSLGSRLFPSPLRTVWICLHLRWTLERKPGSCKVVKEALIGNTSIYYVSKDTHYLLVPTVVSKLVSKKAVSLTMSLNSTTFPSFPTSHWLKQKAMPLGVRFWNYL